MLVSSAKIKVFQLFSPVLCFTNHLGYGFPHFHEINIPCFRAGVKCENQSFSTFFTSPLFLTTSGYGFPHFTGSIYHVSVLVSSAKIKKREKFLRRRARPRRQPTGVPGARPRTGGSCGGQSPPKCSLSQCRAHAPVSRPGRYRHTPRPVRIPYRALIAEKQSRGTGLTGVCGRSAPPTPRRSAAAGRRGRAGGRSVAGCRNGAS